MYPGCHISVDEMPWDLKFGLKPYLCFSINYKWKQPDDSNAFASTGSSPRDGIILLIEGPTVPESPIGIDVPVTLQSKTPTHEAQDSIGIFAKLPPEVRIMIWKATLVSEGAITRAHTLIAPQKDIKVSYHPPVADIDAAILRTCRTIYHEALSILYGHSRFFFCSVSEIQNFRSCRLPRLSATEHGIQYIFGLKPEIHGRFTFVRRIYLFLDSRDFPQSLQHRLETPWQEWCEFFEPEEREKETLDFPALEDLSLDFGDWKLRGGESSRIRVRCDDSLSTLCMLMYFSGDR